MPIVDPLKHGEILTLLDKLSREEHFEREASQGKEQQSPTQFNTYELTEQVEHLLQPVEIVKIQPRTTKDGPPHIPAQNYERPNSTSQVALE